MKYHRPACVTLLYTSKCYHNFNNSKNIENKAQTIPTPVNTEFMKVDSIYYIPHEKKGLRCWFATMEKDKLERFTGSLEFTPKVVEKKNEKETSN